MGNYTVPSLIRRKGRSYKKNDNSKCWEHPYPLSAHHNIQTEHHTQLSSNERHTTMTLLEDVCIENANVAQYLALFLDFDAIYQMSMVERSMRGFPALAVTEIRSTWGVRFLKHLNHDLPNIRRLQIDERGVEGVLDGRAAMAMATGLPHIRDLMELNIPVYGDTCVDVLTNHLKEWRHLKKVRFYFTSAPAVWKQLQRWNEPHHR